MRERKERERGPCERCRKRPRVELERYCYLCRACVLREMAKKRYLEAHPPGRSSSGSTSRSGAAGPSTGARDVARRPTAGLNPAPPPPAPKTPPTEPGQVTEWLGREDYRPDKGGEVMTAYAWLKREARAAGYQLRRRGNFWALFEPPSGKSPKEV